MGFINQLITGGAPPCTNGIYIYMWLSNNNGYYMVNMWLMMINNNLVGG